MTSEDQGRTSRKWWDGAKVVFEIMGLAFLGLALIYLWSRSPTVSTPVGPMDPAEAWFASTGLAGLCFAIAWIPQLAREMKIQITQTFIGMFIASAAPAYLAMRGPWEPNWGLTHIFDGIVALLILFVALGVFRGWWFGGGVRE